MLGSEICGQGRATLVYTRRRMLWFRRRAKWDRYLSYRNN